MTPGRHPNSGLWWAVLFFGALGAIVCSAMYFNKNFFSSPGDFTRYFNTTILITVLLVGLFSICATAQWWMHR